MNRITFLVVIYFVAGSISGSKQQVSPQVLQQSEIGKNGCGPCAVINSLQFAQNSKALNALDGKSSLEKARSFIATYGNALSIPYGAARTAYSDANGTADVDLDSMVRRFFEDNKMPPVIGCHIQRKENETGTSFVKRFRDLVSHSIDRGFHPVLSVRALAAEYNKSEDRYFWSSKGGHCIAIHSIGKIGNKGLSVTIDFSDSLSGELQSGLVYLELDRPAQVPLTFTVNDKGNEQWNWVKNDETLTFIAPIMPLGTKRTKWMERTFIAMRYLIYQPVEQGAESGKEIQ